MYTGLPFKPLPPSVADAGKADGFIHLCRQSALGFGSDRRTPVDFRPVVRLRSEPGRFVVLPCTRSNSVDSAEFFALTAERAMWKRPDSDPGAAFWRYEVVSAEEAPDMIGTLTQSARVDLLKWLRGRY